MNGLRYKIEMNLTGLTPKMISANIANTLKSRDVTYDSDKKCYTFSDEHNREWEVYNAENIKCQKVVNGEAKGTSPMFSGKIITPFLDKVDMKNISDILENLKSENALVNETCNLSIVAKSDNFNDQSRENIGNIFLSKGHLILKAIGFENDLYFSNDTPNDNVVNFNIFKSTLDFDRLEANVMLTEKLCQMSMEQKNISPVRKETPNEKYALRTFMLRLGFIGDEYKSARKILLENLEGNSAWRMGQKIEKFESVVDRTSENDRYNTVEKSEEVSEEILEENISEEIKNGNDFTQSM